MCEPQSNSCDGKIERRESAPCPREDDVADSYPLQEVVARAAGWDEPQMDDYNDYVAPQGRD